MADLIDFGDESPKNVQASGRADSPKAKTPGYSLASELASFDPLVAPTPEKTQHGLQVPAVVAAAFSATRVGSAMPSMPLVDATLQRLAGTWHYKRDQACTYMDFDSEFEVRVEGGRIQILETLPDVGEASGWLAPRGECYEAELVAKGAVVGSVRIHAPDATSGTLTRSFKRQGSATWEQEVTAQRGLSHDEQASLMSLGVAGETGRSNGLHKSVGEPAAAA